ncbi:hypothetical protein LIER_21849 [Lithospermum erythrorhizon]|uniref:Uncharacterized protein n=1 Tax=Lithospermum erythrorhizon TaxID=34254 RepID=A0AAV3QRW2_LITER
MNSLSQAAGMVPSAEMYGAFIVFETSPCELAFGARDQVPFLLCGRETPPTAACAWPYILPYWLGRPSVPLW